MTDQPIRVNFSDEEASSEARDFTPLPSGKYNVFITDGETKESKSEKNRGKPFWALEFTVSDGPYESRKLWTNVMLFEGALYSLVQLLKATGREDALQSGEIPPLDFFIGQQVTLNVRKERNKYMEDKAREQGEDPVEPRWRSEVKGIKKFGDTPVSTGAPATQGKSSSLLP
jgi:hypothetical protein